MIKMKSRGNATKRINDYRTSRMFARMLSIFGWAFLLVWLILGVRYGIPLGQEIHALVVKFVWGDTPLLLVNLFLVMWLLALIMFGFMFVVAGQGMRAVFEMANSSKQLVRMAEEEFTRRASGDELTPLEENTVTESMENIAEDVPQSIDEGVVEKRNNEPSLS